MLIKSREKRREYEREYRKKNRERINLKKKEYGRKDFQKHKEKRMKKAKEWKKNNREKYNIYMKERHKRIRNSFLELYGSRCACCGEAVSEFLSLDHINGQKGKKKQSSIRAYTEAIREHRPDLFRILCHNCNQAIGYWGYCPHKKRNRK